MLTPHSFLPFKSLSISKATHSTIVIYTICRRTKNADMWIDLHIFPFWMALKMPCIENPPNTRRRGHKRARTDWFDGNDERSFSPHLLSSFTIRFVLSCARQSHVHSLCHSNTFRSIMPRTTHCTDYSKTDVQLRLWLRYYRHSQDFRPSGTWVL